MEPLGSPQLCCDASVHLITLTTNMAIDHPANDSAKILTLVVRNRKKNVRKSSFTRLIEFVRCYDRSSISISSDFDRIP